MSNSQADLQKQIEEQLAVLAKLKSENAALLAEKRKEFRMNVGEKGGVSVYGMGRFPVTLYPEQWERLFTHAEEVRTFISMNKSKIDAIAKAKTLAKKAV